jgi:gentisate 1,2-dioxygenase
MVYTMSSTSAPRLRSFTGFLKPWSIGPTATTPALLARYAVIRANEELAHNLSSSGQVYHVIRGAGATACGGERFVWKQGDTFCLPGHADVVMASGGGAILLVVSNEPELNYLRATSGEQTAAAIRPTLFLAEEVDRQLNAVHGRNTEQRAAGKSVVFLTELMAERRLTTPTLLCAINSLEPGGDQRPHKHSSAALTLSIAGDGVFTKVDGIDLAWEPDTLIVTPPYAVHSHHNRGGAMMRSFVAQDTGLHTELRTLSFAWTDG